jgi:NitT/TauT family transport system permease protein
MRKQSDLLGLKRDFSVRKSMALAILSFVVPLLVWSVVSYVPFIWHPYAHITNPGGIDSYSADIDVPYTDFLEQNREATSHGVVPAEGYRTNPVYLPPPHAVVEALYHAFVTPPRMSNEPWLYESLGHSIKIIFLGFLLSSALGVPLGILCGTYRLFSGLFEPFIEFFRYLPAPAFGALCVAVLGIDDGPKIALIFIGTFFQQVLVIANDVRRIDPALLEAAQTLGASGWQLVWNVVVPASVVSIFTDLRILLGWAWTYLIVAEVLGTTSGITYFINQQARYRGFENVYAAILTIGMIGFATDFLLGLLGRHLFPWQWQTLVSIKRRLWFPVVATGRLS